MNQHTPSGRMSPPSASTRGGMSLIEVMVAVTVLAIGLLAVVGQIAPLNNQRQFTDDTQIAQNLLKSISERLATAQFDSLRTDAVLWSYARRLPLSNGTLPTQDPPEAAASASKCQPVRPLNDTDSVEGNNLVKQGLVSRGTGLKNLQVFIEYYRSLSRFSPPLTVPLSFEKVGLHDQLGLLCEANPAKPLTPAEFRTLVNDSSTHYRYAIASTPAAATATDPAGHDHRFDAVLVRVVITWGDGYYSYANPSGSLAAWRNNRRIEAWTGIRSSSEQ